MKKVMIALTMVATLCSIGFIGIEHTLNSKSFQGDIITSFAITNYSPLDDNRELPKKI